MRLPRPFRLPAVARWMLPAMLVALLAACATATPSKRDDLDARQAAWASAIRWNNFEGATNLLDPELRRTAPPTSLELERYQQVQISAYRDQGASADLEAGTAVRDIEIGVINRHTQAERTVRYRETWRWDPAAKAWWITSGLPDLWAGQ